MTNFGYTKEEQWYLPFGNKKEEKEENEIEENKFIWIIRTYWLTVIAVSLVIVWIIWVVYNKNNATATSTSTEEINKSCDIITKDILDSLLKKIQTEKKWSKDMRLYHWNEYNKYIQEENKNIEKIIKEVLNSK
jgi:hypothetical protein